MPKLYWTKDVKKIIDKKIEEDSAILVNDHNMSEENLFKFVRDLRIFKKYADELIEKMEEIDVEYDEDMARFKAECEAKEDGEKPNDE